MSALLPHILRAVALSVLGGAAAAGTTITCEFDVAVSDKDAVALSAGKTTALSSAGAPFRPETTRLEVFYELTGVDGTRQFHLLGTGNLVSQTIIVMPDGRSVRTQYYRQSPNNQGQMGVHSEVGRCEVLE